MTKIAPHDGRERSVRAKVPGPGLVRAQYPDRSLHDRVVHAIGRKILGGQLRPGALLPAEPELGASRTVLREAIKVLAAKGLVESRPKTGTRVRPREAWNLLDADVLAWQQDGAGSPSLLRALTEVRRFIEPAAAELAALRADTRDLAELARALEEMGRTAQGEPDGDFEPFVQADMRFHLAILHACRNELLEQMIRMVYSALLVSFRATSRVSGQARRSLPKHRAIFEAIRARNPRGAAAAMRRLVQATAREVEAIGRRRPRGFRVPNSRFPVRGSPVLGRL